MGRAVKEKIPKIRGWGLCPSRLVPDPKNSSYRPTADEARLRSLTLKTSVDGTPFELLP
jgi:hypothetical protein